MKTSARVSRYIGAVLLLAAGIQSCALAAPKQEQIAVPSIAPVTLKFRAVDPLDAPVNERKLLGALLKALLSASQVDFSSDSGYPIEKLRGLQASVDEKSSSLVFQYVNLERHNTGNEYGQILAVPVAYKIERDTGVATITLTAPAQGALTTRQLFPFPSPKVRQPESFADLSRVLASAPRVKIGDQAVVKGEVDGKFGVAASLGNFDRLLGRHGELGSNERGYEPGREYLFSYSAGSNSVPLKVIAFPYREGAKIQYQAGLSYVIAADGSVEGYELPKKLVQDIERIIND